MVEFLTCYTQLYRAAVCKHLDASIKGQLRNVILECKLKLTSRFLIYGLLTIVNLQYYMHSKTLHPPSYAPDNIYVYSMFVTLLFLFHLLVRYLSLCVWFEEIESCTYFSLKEQFTR